MAKAHSNVTVGISVLYICLVLTGAKYIAPASHGPTQTVKTVNGTVSTKAGPLFRLSGNSTRTLASTGRPHTSTTSLPCHKFYQDFSGDLYSPKWPNPYPTNIKCEYRILSPFYPVSSLLTLNFRSFHMSDCDEDYMEIYNMEDDDGAIYETFVGQYCQSNKPPSIISSHGDALLVRFVTTTGNVNGLYNGFHATFSVQKNDIDDWTINYWLLTFVIMVTIAILAACYKSMKNSRFKRRRHSSSPSRSSIGDTPSISGMDTRYLVSYNPSDFTSPVRFTGFSGPPPYSTHIPSSENDTTSSQTPRGTTEDGGLVNFAYDAMADADDGSLPPSYEEATKRPTPEENESSA
ncbi:uncharacterized protein [Ptychodera flava]|uniref:uncharacterized protein isoform X2 n=1 Tax=Ptychodera flava TaxID=63121 RepID=UPI00396A4CD0